MALHFAHIMEKFCYQKWSASLQPLSSVTGGFLKAYIKKHTCKLR